MTGPCQTQPPPTERHGPLRLDAPGTPRAKITSDRAVWQVPVIFLLTVPCSGSSAPRSASKSVLIRASADIGFDRLNSRSCCAVEPCAISVATTNEPASSDDEHLLTGQCPVGGSEARDECPLAERLAPTGRR